ncbi:MAG: hypothetical protein KTR24_06415 [Saprospiraceae bacterium]|nr:hypothetical protein [Saprospiraceae bacterium]
MKTALLLFGWCSLTVLTIHLDSQNYERTVHKNGMRVHWQYQDSVVAFTMTAPTTGWLAIGFTEGRTLVDMYLLVGRMRLGAPEVREHWTAQPGQYQDLVQQGFPCSLSQVHGIERRRSTELRFTVPVDPLHDKAKPLTRGTPYNLVLAYSMEDDFQHHSIMRAVLKITL